MECPCLCWLRPRSLQIRRHELSQRPAQLSMLVWLVRDHAAYAGLPSNQVMKWEYQVAFGHASGLMVDGPGVEVIAGYGRDHDANLGAATFTSRLGKGTILFQAVRGMQPLLYERFIFNAARFLTGS